jgi:hypothetical protein
VGAANDFPFFHRHVGVAGTLIAQDRGELRPDRFFQQHGEYIAGACGPRGATLGWLLGLNDIGDGFIRGIRTHIEHHGFADGRADPAKFFHGKLDLFAPNQLVQVNGIQEHPQGYRV